MTRSRILALGHYVPERVVKNRDLERILDISDEAIVKRSGVRERRYVEPGTSCSDLAHEASLRALDNAGVEPGELDLIILATLSPDHFFPGSACFLQEKLDVPGIPALDVRNQCSGFIYGLSIADQYIRTGTYRRILVVGSEVHSTGLDFSPTGASVTILFGDGAAAAVLGPSDDGTGLISSRLHADGRHSRELWVQVPGTRYPIQLTYEMLQTGMQYPKMNGRWVFRSAVMYLSSLIQDILKAEGLELDDIKLFVFHQANLRIIESVAMRLKLGPERVYNNLERYGNTTAASIPLALSEAVEEGRVERGDLVMLSAFGSGFTWAGTLLRW